MHIIHREPVVIVGLPVIGAFQDLSHLVPAAWRELFARQAQLPPTGGTFAEASYYLGDGRYHEVVGVTVPADTPVSGHWTVAHLPAGAWAHCRHAGPVQQIADTFSAIERWLHERQHTVDGMKLDVGYRADGQPEIHDLYVRGSLANGVSGDPR
ncbi:GyrI-like domain-containing protein [Micromonospora sp. WMMA1363]|uniref:GyrI-like domain-containing protein n=1 Tax=Micromonospora sp. WMMA1363 TaxID=3053985 RepID=UPI00259C9946|nr:GyrI-like domain-containing protein [Micromonospora sp. WMMA1363]MDM4722876.1 GyrI-like domain-containing protein [Micromonospora sp. WMMA1363]